MESWHALASDEVVLRLESSIEQGLSDQEVKERQSRFGVNALPQKMAPSFLLLFIRQFKNPLIYLLLVAALIAFGIGHYTDFEVILAVLVINAFIGALQEKRAQISMQALKEMTHTFVRVLRNQREEKINAKDLVPGDILLLHEGDAVGADARMIHVSALKVAEASLTGESMPVIKMENPLPFSTPVSDRTNMVFAGTHVVKGKGTAVVVATGGQTEIGQIAVLAESSVRIPTPLEQKIGQFSLQVLWASLAVFLAVMGIGLIRDLPFSTIFMVALSEVVSIVPEGLPVALTVAMAVGIERMAKRGAIVRTLDAVETLGSINVICTDKTGTLTRNEMVVTEILLPHGRKWDLSEIEKGAQDDQLQALIQSAVLCNDAKYGPKGKPMGDPTEISLLELARKGAVSIDQLRRHVRRLGEIPFDPETKMMAVLVEGPEGKRIYIKGAPEAVLPLCRKSGVPEASLMETMAKKSLRLLAFAEIAQGPFEWTQGWDPLKGNAVFLGITGQYDPPRPEAADAVEACFSAGIKPVMVTGDHRETGLSIARMLKIAQAGDKAVDGKELIAISDSALKDKIVHIPVFTRVLPAEKWRIVRAWQQNNAVVAMTGDGVNDAPALATADVGVAMGITGTEVAKEAAKIIITDDNFATIVQAVEEGRIVCRNIKKLLIYLISTGITEIIVLLLALIFGYPLPLIAVQILWTNLVADGIMSFPLVLEPSEGSEMNNPPIPRREPLIKREDWMRMGWMIATMAFSILFYFIYRLSTGYTIEQVQTGTFTVLAVSQWFNALNCQSDTRSAFRSLLSNRWMLWALAIANVLHLSVVFVPTLNHLFHTVPIPLSEVFLIGFLSSLVLWVEEVRKRVAALPYFNQKLYTSLKR